MGNFSNFRITILLLFIIGLFNWFTIAQTFVAVTDPSNPIVATGVDANYSGAAWIDIDGDGDDDLYSTKNYLFRNLGSGNFERINDFQSLSAPQLGNGASWADYDNDGDIDLFLSGNPSLVYSNDGFGNFEAIDETPLGSNDNNRGWTGAWADYNNDGFVDLVITHPSGFLGQSIPSRFLKSNGDGRFTRIDSFEFTTLLKPYTVATWSDYDLDGDADLFIGSGPVNFAAVDYLYNNILVETGSADFERINTSPFATDLQDGQVWNWIDYDNDGDLDAFLTNYSSAPNRFYKNNNGTYESLTNALTLSGAYLGNNWGDIDNDGDLDVVLTNENSTRVFFNNGSDTFAAGSVFSGPARGNPLSDYDNDGDLDMFVTGTGTGKALYENVSSNGNNWVMFSLKGMISNKSAIGAKVKVKATIGGNPVWQMREVSAHNNFNGHNSLRVHFGLGNASSIDSVVFEFPSGQTKILITPAINTVHSVVEDIPAGYLKANFKADIISGEEPLTVQFSDLSISDLNNPTASWEWDFDNDGTIDATDQNPSYVYTQTGIYSVSLIVSNGSDADTLIRTDYVSVSSVASVEGENQLPTEFNLYQNYPNPFNPSTLIKYSIPSESFVTLKVYNVLGTEVATLVNEKKTPGFYELNFGGEKLPSGVYVYRIETGSFTSSKKMLLIK
ncbi:MAG: VCBS repeat-containing protein [Ignavibacteria bacterium]|nr:VCBS repeat-containing protein [Ignavibacteria bacterium]MBT8392029.1 VCBS repeat-containing protein [Ignavibacteria bacterium]